ncbi:MAG TPA: carboxypeptidase regulatory-like domain-containing protein [Gemmatimonadaceae bacterium]|nr:carboxypeptidase regulatory-like domain-containing protein [Gemmatimonadaceae bacterium]
MIHRLSGAVLLLAGVLGGCSTDKKADAAQPPKLKEGSVAPRPTVVTQPATKYQPQTVTGGVRLTGTVDFDGPLPADTVIELPPDAPGCGQRITDHRVVHTGTRIGGAMVWINDIRTGKPLPVTRRFELTNEDCMLSPQVQGVVAPATLDVTSNDVALHLNHIVNVGTGELEAIAPFNDNGEVVPFDRLLDHTEQLEISCTLHPWSKAWILVFDHPYFATTEKTGAFSIEDIPPGTYHVKAWHPLLGVAEQTVTIAAGQTPTLSLKLGSAAAPRPAPDTTAAKAGA